MWPTDFFCSGSYYGNYRTRRFCDIFPDVDTFVGAWRSAEIPQKIKEENARTLYYLLYARYGNDPIASSDENRFKYALWSTVFMYGPAWEKRLEIQDQIKTMSEAELQFGETVVHNEARNPGSAPTTQTLEEIQYIDHQNVSKRKKGKAETYMDLLTLIETDVTSEFIQRFAPLFILITTPQEALWYATEVDDNGMDSES